MTQAAAVVVSSLMEGRYVARRAGLKLRRCAGKRDCPAGKTGAAGFPEARSGEGAGRALLKKVEKIGGKLSADGKISLPLHSQIRKGTVAQLNRASDYGSEGFGFESQQRHFKKADGCSREGVAVSFLLSLPAERAAGAAGEVGREVGFCLMARGRVEA